MDKINLPVFILALGFLLIFNYNPAKAQTTDLLAGNLINGAVTGTLLGVGCHGAAKQ